MFLKNPKTLLPIIILLFINSGVSCVRVCTKFEDYNNPISKNCYENPNDKLNITQIIQSWGFNAQEYKLTTEDSYIISVMRCYKNVTKENNVILGHGAGTGAMAFVYRNNDSLAYQLAENGYDVYLISFRGTRYSETHKTLNKDDADFWKFSFHQLGVHDLRSTIKFVQNVTNKKSIYVGYATASTAGYVYSSLFVDESKGALTGMISVAPIGYVKNIKRFWIVLDLFWTQIRSFLWTTQNGELSFRSDAFKAILNVFKTNVGFIYLFQFFHGFTAGFNFEQMDPESYPIELVQIGENVAVDIITHHLQNKDKNVIRQFDFGVEQNLKEYKSPLPPVYDWGKIAIPTALIVPQNDAISTVESALAFYNSLPQASRCGYYSQNLEKWSRMDALTAKNISTLYDPFFKILRGVEQGTCLTT